MCEVGIPEKYGAFTYTKWDTDSQKCLITAQGCEPSPDNPFSQFPLTDSDEVREFDTEKNPKFDDLWKYAPPNFYINKITPTSGGVPVCSRGNATIYQWCEVPKTRGGGKDMPGITNQKPFKHTVVQGKETCLIGADYCADHAYWYDANKFQCVEPPGLQAADFFGIKTFVQNVSVRGLHEDDILIVALAKMASDSRLKENIRIHTRDYVRPGIHLYTFRWKPWVIELYGKYGNDIGFIADELPKEWTSVDSNGYLQINLDAKHPDMKKIVNFFINKK